MSEHEISVNNLTFTHRGAAGSGGEPSLVGINLHLPKGSRTILVGANGAGKSTLLQILAGRRLVSAPDAKVHIQGRDVFRDSPRGVTFLGTEWAMNPVVRGDITVSAFLDSVGGYRHKPRRDLLLRVLDVDLDWRMHEVSDGERRRVQLVMGLMAPWDVLLLDEVTVDLDVQVRDDLVRFLKEDSEERGSTILYATHIFDGLSHFPTHVAHMAFGALETAPTPWPSTELPERTLYDLALRWLREDRAKRVEMEAAGRRRGRGPGRDGEVPTDSEEFYKKYDYSH